MWMEEDKAPGEKGSLLAAFASSLIIYVVLGAAALLAMAAVGTAVTRKDDLVVEFKAPPSPPAAKVEEPKPKPTVRKKRVARKGPKKKAKRQHFEPPKQIPTDEVEHADTELVEAGDTGPVDGSLDGQIDGQGDGTGDREQKQVPEALPSGGKPASIAHRPTRPDYPEQAREARIEGVVVVRCVVDERGRNRDCRAIRGHALLREVATDYVSQFVMRPAFGPDGERVATLRLFPVRFEARKL